MTITISPTQAKQMAEFIMEDIRDYVQAHQDEYQEYLNQRGE